MNKEYEDKIWLTELEAAKYLKCSTSNLQNFRSSKDRILRDGTVASKPPVYRFGGDYRYEKKELDKWLLSQKVN